jgi:hypothetical protein
MNTETAVGMNKLRWNGISKNINDFNWVEIQAFYDLGNSTKTTGNRFGINNNLLYTGVKNGLLKTRNISESIKLSRKLNKTVMSEDTKKVISERRKKFLSENPDKHPWRNPNKFISEPCQYLKKILKERGIEFIEEYQPLLEQGRFYSIDIAIPDKKIGVEINGNQHYNRDGTLKDYYRTRYDLITQGGWSLYEVHYSLVYNTEFVSKLINSILTLVPLDNFDYAKYISGKIEKQEKNNKPKNKRCACKIEDFNVCDVSNLTINQIQEKFPYRRQSIIKLLRDNNIKYKEDNIVASITKRKFNPTKEELAKIIWELPYTKVAEHYGVSDVAVKKRAKYYSLTLPPSGYWTRINNGYSHEEALNPLPTPESKSKNLTDEQVREIRKKINNGERMVDISKEYGFCYSTIKSIKYGITYTDVI